jgi:ribosomal protein S6--L-glutamate ligase
MLGRALHGDDGDMESGLATPAGITVVGSAQNETNPKLVAAWRALGIDAQLLPPLDVERGLRPGDVVLGRIDVLPTVYGVERGLLELLRLERRGWRVLNRAMALAAAHDKALTSRLLVRAGVPHPRTELLRLDGPPPSIDPPLVLKPRLGSWGVDVYRCDTVDELRRTLEELRRRPWFMRRGAVVQELIPPVGYDLRTLVADGRVVGATSRVPRPGEWRTNISLGAERFAVASDPDAFALAVAAAAAIGADLVAVDLLPTGNGHVVLEVNGAADFDEAYDLDGESVFRAAAQALGLLSPPGASAGPVGVSGASPAPP